MDLFLILLNILLLYVVISQYRKIKILSEQNKKLWHNGYLEELGPIIKKKLEDIGSVKTIKYVREETGMSLVEAKQFVDKVEGYQS